MLFDVYRMEPGATPPTLLETLTDAFGMSCRVELRGPGAGAFSINRYSAQATADNLAQGNLVKVRVPEVDADPIFAFFLESGDFTLLAPSERGGENLRFGGRGILSYLDYAIAWSESFIDGGMDPIDNIWRAYLAGTGSKPGQVLRRLLEEFQDPERPQQPIPHVVPSFDYTLDSAGNPWASSDATAEFAYSVGDGGYEIVQRLMDTGDLIVQMDPDFGLHAYNPASYGRDLAGDAFGAGVVRFEKGVNIAHELVRARMVSEERTHMLVRGELSTYGYATVGGAAGRVTREGHVDAYGTGATALAAIGQAELARRAQRSDEVTFLMRNRRAGE